MAMNDFVFGWCVRFFFHILSKRYFYFFNGIFFSLTPYPKNIFIITVLDFYKWSIGAVFVCDEKKNYDQPTAKIHSFFFIARRPDEPKKNRMNGGTKYLNICRVQYVRLLPQPVLLYHVLCHQFTF